MSRIWIIIADRGPEPDNIRRISAARQLSFGMVLPMEQSLDLIYRQYRMLRSIDLR